MYAIPFATVGVPTPPFGFDAFHSGAHVLGTPEQPVTPAPSNANRFPLLSPT